MEFNCPILGIWKRIVGLWALNVGKALEKEMGVKILRVWVLLAQDLNLQLFPERLKIDFRLLNTKVYKKFHTSQNYLANLKQKTVPRIFLIMLNEQKKHISIIYINLSTHISLYMEIYVTTKIIQKTTHKIYVTISKYDNQSYMKKKRKPKFSCDIFSKVFNYPKNTASFQFTTKLNFSFLIFLFIKTKSSLKY